MYENLECVCKEANETQKHILQECKIINKNGNQFMDYDKIKHGNIIEMVKIASKFKQNLNIRDKL